MYVTKEIEIDLSEFDTEDLIEELETRRNTNTDYTDYNIRPLVEEIYQKRRTSQDYQTELDKLIYAVIGRI